jgi:hypothetical protein
MYAAALKAKPFPCTDSWIIYLSRVACKVRKQVQPRTGVLTVRAAAVYVIDSKKNDMLITSCSCIFDSFSNVAGRLQNPIVRRLRCLYSITILVPDPL